MEGSGCQMTRYLWALVVGVMAMSGCTQQRGPIESTAPSLQKVQDLASGPGSYVSILHMCFSAITKCECDVTLNIKNGDIVTSIKQVAPTCEQAAKKVLERMAKP